LTTRELAHAGEYVKQKKILDAYMKVGGSGAFFLVDVESNEEVHQLLMSLPAAKYFDFEVTPVVTHPLFGGPL
jgi:muconolactone delta-isomerase